MKNKSSSRTASKSARSLLLGIAIIALAFIACAFVISIILYNTEDPTAAAELLSIVAFVVSGAAGAFINTKLFGKEIAALPYASSGIALILFLAISLVSCGKLSGGHMMSALCFVLITVLSAFLAKNRRYKGRTRRKRA